VRSFLVLALVGSLGFLAGCGSSGTPAGIAITITLSPSSATVNANGVVNVVATVANDSTNAGVSWTLSGVGTLSNQTTTSVTYTAPATVTTTSVATVVATSKASSSVTASLPITVAPAGSTANVVPISVNGGPLTTANPPSIYANGVFASVQICVPGTSTCQTIDDVLVDTGSVGLRLLGSQLNSQLTTSLVPYTVNGNVLYNCVSFLDGSFLWGPVAPATIVLGGETTAALPTSVQVIENPSFGIPGSCSTNGTGTNEDTQATLGANGILGVGPEPFDCGTACDPSVGGTAPPVYYTCGSGGGCSTAFVSCGTLCSDPNPNAQVTNPVFNFPVDNNGVIVELPAVNDVAATIPGCNVPPVQPCGQLVFGIGTQSNNALPSTATVLNLSSDNFTTNFGGQALTMSFIDSGSNGLFFPQINASPTICTDSTTWYCPASTTPFSATNVGASGSPSSTVNFNVDNFDNVTSANPTDAAFSNIAGPQGNGGGCSSSNTPACTFDWGLPFFYGRNVFTAIDGTTVGTTSTPFFAY
jgi:hypothetical protein